MSAPPRPAPPPGELTEPVKNRFFYGMLLDEHTLTREQRYFEDKRRLLNRLGLGYGVLAGLSYQAADGPDRLYQLTEKELLAEEPAAGEPVTHVRLAPGVAIDGYGREVVVPSDTCGNELVFEIGVDDPTGPNPHHRAVPAHRAEFVAAARRRMTSPPPGHLTLFYLVLEIQRHEIESDQAPVRAGTCLTECRPSAVREGFAVRFRPVSDEPVWDPPAPVPGGPNEEPARSSPLWPADRTLLDVFPQEPPEAFRHRHKAQRKPDLAAQAVLPRPGRDDPRLWVPLGVFRCLVTGEGKTTAVTITHFGRYYRQLWGNDALSRLVFGLAERVDEAARVRILTHDGVDGASGEGQAAPVYHDLPDPLKVQVVSSLPATPAKPAGGALRDYQSVSVQFDVLTPDGGKLYTGQPGDSPRHYVSAPLPVGPDGRVSVRWELGRQPGLHTVAARIVPSPAVGPGHPRFHPGSQVLFHATATPTAPTIVGMGFPYWGQHRPPRQPTDPRQQNGGVPPAEPPLPPENVLRIFFSRRIAEAELRKPDGEPDRKRDGWLKAWRMVGGKSASSEEKAGVQSGLGVGPWQLKVTPYGAPRPVGGDPTEAACWFADYLLGGLLEQLCPCDLVRVLILIQPTKDLASVPFPAPNLFPVEQILDADFDGSFASPAYRDKLWHAQPFDDPQVAPARDYVDALQRLKTLDALPPVTAAQAEALRRLWERFQPRDRSFPSGDGTEGGKFHNAFDLRYVPC